MTQQEALMDGPVVCWRRQRARLQSRGWGAARRGLHAAGRLALLAVVVGWLVYLRPESLGGPTGYVSVSGTSMLPLLHAGDLVITQRAAAYDVGDVIAYIVPADHPAAGARIIHRIVGLDEAGRYLVRGDNTNGPDVWHPTPPEVAGRAWLTVPGAGRLLAILRQPVLLASVAAALAVMYLFARPATARAGGSAGRR